jgi:hypothetical protein
LKEIGLRLEFNKMKMYASEDWEEEALNDDEIEELEYELTKKFGEIDQIDKDLGRSDSETHVDPHLLAQDIFKKKGIEKAIEEKKVEAKEDQKPKSPKEALSGTNTTTGSNPTNAPDSSLTSPKKMKIEEFLKR